ncbi:MAG: serine hydrolase domain-containing protein, partial [Hyphococcus sp.]
MRLFFRFIAGFLLFLLIALSGPFLLLRISFPAGDPPAESVVKSEQPRVKDAIAISRQDLLRVRQGQFYPSVSVGVVRDGALLWSEVIGYDDIKTKTPATAQSVYPIGSVSKPLTAALVMKMHDQGRLDIDRPIGDYASDIPQTHKGLTLRQLLSHQAGVRHYKFLLNPPVFTENGLNREFETTKESLQLFINDPLLFEPDAGFSYSTFGYTLASYVVEQATGEQFIELMQQELTTALGLTNTAPDRSSAPAPHRVKGYLSVMRKLGLLPAPETNASYKYAGGGYLSTTRDLATFGDALVRGRFLSEDSYTQMTTART